jgi:hypothetical protein
MGSHADTHAILAAAAGYTVHKCEHELTVGLHFAGGVYGEAVSPAGDLDEAVLEAFRRAMRHRGQQVIPPGGGGNP